MRSNLKTFALILSITILLSSCASIVSKSSYPISINSSPSEAKISVTNRKGIQVFTGITPATLKLNSGSGFFRKEHYQVKFEKEGYEEKTVPIYFKTDGWYFGNILLGGIIGMLIVDPATGAMYKLDTEFLNEILKKSDESSELKVYGVNEIPREWEKHLISIN